MKHHNHHYNKSLLYKARYLRSENATKAERYLWKSTLSNRQTGVRFLRQRSIANFIVDFFAPEIGLIIEIDGSSHFMKSKYDFYREQKLLSLGYHIIRFQEGQVLNQIEDVTLQILHVIDCLWEDEG